MKLSLVITVMNEEENIRPLVAAIREALQELDYEVIFVDDGSVDGTCRAIREEADERITLLELRKNYGQSTAMMAGIDHAQGEFIATMDGDLQNDPSDIPMMLQKMLDQDCDVVAGNRANRQDGMVMRKLPSRMANFIIRHLTDVHIRDYGCTLKIFRREIAAELGLYGELHRFIPVLAHLQGARIVQVDVKHHPRRFGRSKYGINRTFKVSADLMLMIFFQKYMHKPMHLFGPIGLAAFTVGALINIYLLVLKVLGHDIWGKPILILGVLLLLGGIQFITIGLVAEVNVRTYYESQGKKTYRIRKVYRGGR